MEKRKKRKSEYMRSSLQGIGNILRFNWHYYLIIVVIIFALYILNLYVLTSLKFIIESLIVILIFNTMLSLIVSYYIYDYSDLYQFHYIKDEHRQLTVLNIHAGFDETSEIIKTKFPNGKVTVLDFYNPELHTEISIERARKAYPSFSNTLKTSTSIINFPNDYFDKICVIFSAHEIRNTDERIQFFNELNRILKLNGELYITEHLRDIPNLLIYTVGAFHFYSKKNWEDMLFASEFIVKHKSKSTLFVSNYILIKNGITT